MVGVALLEGNMLDADLWATDPGPENLGNEAGGGVPCVR